LEKLFPLAPCERGRALALAALRDEDFNFKGRVLQGTKELLPRWKRCVSSTDRQLGEALARSTSRNIFRPGPKPARRRLLVI